MGLKASDVVIGYEKAQRLALDTLEELFVEKVEDLRDQDEPIRKGYLYRCCQQTRWHRDLPRRSRRRGRSGRPA